MNCCKHNLHIVDAGVKGLRVVADEKCLKVFDYDNEGREIPKQWYTFINIGYGIVEARFAEKLTYGAAVELGNRHCDVNGFKYIGTCDIFGRSALRESATDMFLANNSNLV